MYERWTRSFLKLWNEVMNYEEKRGRDLIIVAVIITLVFVTTILLQNSYGSNGGNHSIDNKSNNGISVFMKL